MDQLQNLDIHEFLASLGKHAVARSTKRLSDCQSKQSKCSDIVFVEDTDEYAQLSNGFAGKEDKGKRFSEWKARDYSPGWGAKGNGSSFKSKNKAQPNDNRGWGEKKEDTSSEWGTSTWNDSDSGWEKNDKSVGGWDKGTQEKGSLGGWGTCTQQTGDDGWGEVGRWKQEANRNVTRCPKEEVIVDGWQKGPEKAMGQRSSKQERKDEGWRSRFHKEDDGGWKKDTGVTCSRWGKKKEVSAPGGSEGSTQGEGIDKGWGNSISDENAVGCQDVNSPGVGWGADALNKGDDGGWGEDKSTAAGWGQNTESFAPSGWERGTEEEGSQDGWGSSKHKEKWEVGSQEKDGQTKWGDGICQGTTNRWGAAKSGAGGWDRETRFASAGRTEDPHGSTYLGWECTAKKEGDGGWGVEENGGTTSGWGKEAKGGWGVHTLRNDFCTQSEHGTSSEGNTGWQNDKTDTANGWGGEKKAASGKWGKGTQKGSNATKWVCERELVQGGWGGEKEGNCGTLRNVTQKERANCGWRRNNDAGWGKRAEGSAGGWGQRTHQEADDDGWGSNIQGKVESAGEENNFTFSGWGEKSGDGGGLSEEALRGWGGEKKSDIGSRLKERVTSGGGGAGSTQDKSSAGWGEATEGTAGGWEQSTHKEADDGWASSVQKDVQVGWGEQKDFTYSGWTERKGVADDWQKDVPGGWGGAKKFAPGRGRDGKSQGRASSGWRGSNDRRGNAGWVRGTEGSAGGWGQSTQKQVDDGWGSRKKEAEVTWGKRRRNPGDVQEEIDCGWGKKQVVDSLGGWGDTTQDKEKCDDGWGSSINKDASNGWGEKVGTTGVFVRGSAQADEFRQGWKDERGVAFGDWKHGAEATVACSNNSTEKGDPCSERESRTEDTTHAEVGKVREGAVTGWQQGGRPRDDAAPGWEQVKSMEVKNCWEERVNDGWGRSIEKEVDSGWGEVKDFTASGWEEERNGTACGWGEEGDGWGRGSQAKEATFGWGNNVTNSESEKGSMNAAASTSLGNRLAEESDAGWATTTAASAGWEQNTSMENEDGWGVKKEVTMGQNLRNKGFGHWGNSSADSPESGGVEKRRSGTFGPSGSNTVPLGKRRSFVKGSNGQEPETKNRGEPSHDDQGVSGFHPYGSQRWGKGFNHGHTGFGRRDPASNNSQGRNGRPHLKSLINLPEYSELDELYKATNRILHHSGYLPGDRLNADDESFILEKVLAHHREKESKLGCGVNYIMIDSHADHQVSCFWVVRKDGSKTDFSYWKCLEHLFEMNYPHAVREAHKEGNKEDSTATNVESAEAHAEAPERENREDTKDAGTPMGMVEAERAEEKENREETKDVGTSVGSVPAEGQASRQEADDGW